LKGVNLVSIVLGTHEIAKIMYHNLLNSPIIYSPFLISHIVGFFFFFFFFGFSNLEKNPKSNNSLFKMNESTSSSLTIVVSLERSLVITNEEYFHMQELRDYVFIYVNSYK
jgi:hypothetical protein